MLNWVGLSFVSSQVRLKANNSYFRPEVRWTRIEFPLERFFGNLQIQL